jgi:hypothetical protein
MMAGLSNSMARVVQAELNKEWSRAASMVANGKRNVTSAVTSGKKRMQGILDTYYRKAGRMFGDDVLDAMERQNLIEKSTDGYEAKGIRDDYWSAFIDWARSEAATQVKGINATTTRQISTIIAQGVHDQKGIKEIARDIRKKSRIKNPTRALTIARTEMLKGMNKSIDSSIEATGVKMRREWSALFDTRVRNAHKVSDGQKRSQKVAFRVGGEKLMYPGDTSLGASAKNIVNCRCTLMYHAVRKRRTR